MTRSEILALPAGPELDALVAEKVMGWSPEDSGWACLPRHETGGPRCRFAPSTSIAHAWKVLEKVLGSLVGSIDLGSGYGPDGENWRFAIKPEIGKVAEAYELTAPLAICRAALLAVME